MSASVTFSHDGVFVTRSVRRLPTPFVLEPLGEITTSPWDHGYAFLGHCMLYTKKISTPLAVSMPMIDVDAEHVKTYAAKHVGSDSDREDPLEVGNETGETKASNTADKAIDSGSMDAPGPTTSQKRGGADSPALPGGPKKQRVGDDQPTTPRDDTMDPSGERAPKTPRLENSMLQVTSTDLSLYEHEDSPVKFDFDSDDVDYMDKYDMEFYDDQFLHEDDPCLIGDADMSKITEQLTFPHSAKEPGLSADELLRLDALAGQLELQRLERLKVLQSLDCMPSTSKVLSTRFVRTRREKHNSKGETIWLRRSRFVAREFARLEPERENLFSPASGSIISRVLPTVFLERREKENMVMASLDVRDAFLTVKQEKNTLVRATDASGTVRSYSLGKVLPGQRDGSLLWYRATTNFLKSKLGLEEHTPYPCILRSKDGSCVVMIHVDDLFVVGKRDYVLGKFMPELKAAYDISVQCIEKPGD